MQDLLKLGNEARMNAPSTVGYNWRWRLNKEQLAESRRAWMNAIVFMPTDSSSLSGMTEKNKSFKTNIPMNNSKKITSCM